MKEIGNFIPIWKFCDKNNIQPQNVYRWIREGKVPSDKMKKIEKIVTRILIDESFEMSIRKIRNKDDESYE